MALQFIHTADLHIDSPLKGLTSKDDEVAQKVRNATRDAFAALVTEAIKRQVAFVVIAGDIFDGKWDDVGTGIWTAKQFDRLAEASIPVFMLYGNHDKKNPILRNLGLPKNVKVFSDSAPERIHFPEDCPDLDAKAFDERITLTGQGYSDWKCKVDLAAKYPDREEGRFNIGVLHTGLGGDSATDYAPTSVETLLSKNYDYWALGHQHKREVFPYAGGRWIGYSGSLQGRHINETGPKGFYLVTVEDGKLSGSPEFICVDTIRWSCIEVDATGIEYEEDLKKAFREKIEESVVSAEGRYVAARVVFSGRTSLYSELHQWREENQFDSKLYDTILEYRDQLWIEGYQIGELTPPIPDNFWENGVLREIKTDVEAVIAELAAKKQDEPLSGTITPIDDLRKKLSTCKSALRGDNDTNERGIDVDSPSQITDWYRQALDIIANAFNRS
ncbi:MAG: DNA repair exonuclease [Thermoguttaceae bacterium]|nr:DNA repair exonuclease [Thermoguttaceae bacterium]